LGSSVLDAMSVGLPVIATKAGGIPEIAKDKVNGILCEIGDAKGLANAVCELADSKELRKFYWENSMKMVQEFSIENTYQKYMELYTSLLSV